MLEDRQFLKRPLAIVHLETTGLDETQNEIIDFGVVVINQESLDIVYTMSNKIKPEHIETASQEALRVNGYNEEAWKYATSLESALSIFSKITQGAILTSWNYHFEAKFLDAACRKTGFNIGLDMDYHMRGVETLASELLRNAVRLNPSGEKEILQRENMKIVAEFLGTGVEPEPHKALEGAYCAYRIYKRLREIIDSMCVVI